MTIVQLNVDTMRITPPGGRGEYLGAESHEHVLIFVRDTNQLFGFTNITLAKEKANFPPDGAILPFVQPTFNKSALVGGKKKTF